MDVKHNVYIERLRDRRLDKERSRDGLDSERARNRLLENARPPERDRLLGVE